MRKKERKTITVEIDPERVRDIADNADPQVRQVLEGMFPQIFEDARPLLRIGCMFTRRKYMDCLYALFKWNGEVRVLNVTYNQMWKSSLKVSDLTLDENQLTVGEFKRLMGLNDIGDITFCDAVDDMKTS